MVCLYYEVCGIFFFQAEDGIRDLVRSRGLGDVYKRQLLNEALPDGDSAASAVFSASTKSPIVPPPANETLSLIHI